MTVAIELVGWLTIGSLAALIVVLAFAGLVYRKEVHGLRESLERRGAQYKRKVDELNDARKRLFREWVYRELLDGWDDGKFRLVERSEDDIDAVVNLAALKFHNDHWSPYGFWGRPRPKFYDQSEANQRSYIVEALRNLQARREPKPKPGTTDVTITLGNVQKYAENLREISKAIDDSLKKR